MSKGRKPIPTELKRLTGNAGKRRLNNAEPKISAGLPHCPKWLDSEAKAMWNRVVHELSASGIVTKADEGVLTGYCVAYGQLVRARKVATKVLVPGAKGGTKSNPAIGVVNSTLTILRSLGSELGLTPVARSRLQTPTSDEDEYDRVMNGSQTKSVG